MQLNIFYVKSLKKVVSLYFTDLSAFRTSFNHSHMSSPLPGLPFVWNSYGFNMQITGVETFYFHGLCFREYVCPFLQATCCQMITTDREGRDTNFLSFDEMRRMHRLINSVLSNTSTANISTTLMLIRTWRSLLQQSGSYFNEGITCFVRFRSLGIISCLVFFGSYAVVGLTRCRPALCLLHTSSGA